MAGLTRIKTNNILDREVREQDLADAAVTFDKINITSGGSVGESLKVGAGGTLLWELASGSTNALDTLVDVDTIGKLNGDSLVYDVGSGLWKAGSNVPSSLGLNSLTNVTLTTPLVQNEFLRYDGIEWINDAISVVYIDGIQPVAITGLLDNLVDVVVPSPTVNQHLVFDGSVWRASDAANVGSIDQLDDVDTTTVTPISGDALVWDGVGDWAPFAIVGLGASSNTFMVADITARDLLTPADGDQSFVRSGATTSEWEMYIWDVLAGPAAWILISTQDSASTDAKTIEAIVVPATISPVLLGNVSPDSRVTVVTIEVTIAFDGSPTLSVGDSGDNARLIDDSLHDLSELGTYSTTTDYVYGGSTDTDINGYFSAGGATTGSARILVTYV